jgi:urea transport system permease protein
MTERKRDAPAATAVRGALAGFQGLSGRYAGPALAVLALAGVPLLYRAGLISIETVNMLGRYTALAIVAVGLDLVWGTTGVLSLCQSLFFALGGYAMGMYLALHGPLDEGVPRALYVVSSSVEGIKLPWFWKPFYTLPATVILGLLIPAVVAFLIGLPGFASRVRGVFFSILTQAITLAAWLIFCRNDLKLCGTNGLTNFETIAGFDLKSPGVKLGLYLFTVLALIGTYALCRGIAGSRVGRVLVAIRENETRLRFFGFKPHHYKVFVFTLAGAAAGLGGMLYAPQMGIFTPKYMEAKESILMVIWVAVGGRGTLSGAIAGALVVNLVYNFLTSRWQDSWQFVQGALFVGVVLLFPNGLMSIWQRWLAIPFKRGGSGPAPSGPGAPPVAAAGAVTGDIRSRLERISALRNPKRPSPLAGDLLRVENVQVVFDGFKALDIDSFSLGHRDLRVIIGPNGAGKTTLCDVLSGKTRPTRGQVYFGDKEITRISDFDIARLGIGRKFQTPTPFDSLTVHQNMELATPGQKELRKAFRRSLSSEERDRIDAILRRVGLLGVARRQARYLSHGQRQWLEISMLLLAGPLVLLIDEPAAGLTDEETVLTAELLLETQAEHSIIVIEHDMEFVRLLNSWVTVLNEGKIMAEGWMSDIESNEKVVEAYLGR